MIIKRSNIIGSFVIFLFYLIVAQDLVCSLLFKFGFPSLFIKLCTFLKEIIIICIGIALTFNIKVSRGRLLFTFFFIYASAFLFISDLSLYYTLLGYRTYVLIFFCFIIGEQLSRQAEFERRFFKHIKFIFLCVFIFSVLEYFVLPTSLWTNVFPIIEMKRQVLGLTIDEFGSSGVQVNAYGELTKRMIGPFNDPLTLSYFVIILLDFFIAVAIFRKDESKWRALCATALVLLTQTRATILGLVISVGAIMLKDFKVRKKHVLIMVAIIFMSASSIVIFWAWFDAFVNSIFSSEGRNIGHITAYLEGIKTILDNPLGYGIGSSSVIVTFASSSIGTENAFINLTIEIGVIGFALLLGALFYFLLIFRKYLSTRSIFTPGYLVVAAGFLLLVQYIFAGFVAPHILIARIVIPFMLVVGWAYGVARGAQSE